MGDSETVVKTPIRVTRSSSSSTTTTTTTPKQNSPQKPKPGSRSLKNTKASFSDYLLFPKPITLDQLYSSYPCRKAQIDELLHLIGPPNSPMKPIFIYGRPSSAKTSVLLHVFKHLNRPFVYSSCKSCYNPRLLFESVLNQVFFHGKQSTNNYASAKRCEKASDFMNFLREALVHTIATIRENQRPKGSKNSLNCGAGEMIYLIFDNVEMIRDWDSGLALVSVLFKMGDLLKMPELGLVFISSASLDSFYGNTGLMELVPVFFPSYTDEELYQIFMRGQPNPKLYSSFLGVVLKTLCRLTKRVDELSVALVPLFRKYCEPLSDLRVIPDEAMKRKLFSCLQPHIMPSLNQVFKVESGTIVETNKEKEKRKGILRKQGSGETVYEVDFQMSDSAKYLLISAFIASKNPATLDAALFDSTGGSDNRKRKRKSSVTSIEKKDQAAQEMLLKGPGTFPLERLLAIFQCITSVTDGPIEREQVEDGLTEEVGSCGLMSDVLLQLSTLCNANFICKGGSCPLEGSTRYRATIDEDMVMKIARSVNFPLAKYLYRR
ncbi:hypothetical protein AMTRI_Chr01g102400 [Amborella trichopoda]